MGCIIIDDKLLDDIKLNNTDRVVFGVIKALSNNKGYCFATNEYIGSRAKVSKSTVSNTIGKLKRNNYIKSETIDYQRRIYIIDEDISKLSEYS